MLSNGGAAPLQPVTPHIDWSKVKSSEVEKVVKKLWGNAAPSTWNVALAAITKLSDDLIEQRKRKKPLIEKLAYRKVPNRLPRPVAEKEVSEIFRKVTDPQDKLLFEILVGSGLRATEAATLCFGQIDTSGILKLVGKGNKERQTFVTHAGMRALKEWTVYGPHMGYTTKLSDKELDEAYWTFAFGNPDRGIFLGSRFPVIDMARPSNWVLYRVKRYTDSMPHEFRHFWVTDLLNNGADMLAVMDAAGHENIKTTKGYKKVLSRETNALRAKHSREQGLI